MQFPANESMLILPLFFGHFFPKKKITALNLLINVHVFQQSGFASSSSLLSYMQFLLKIPAQWQIQQINISDILAILESHLFECRQHDSA